MKLDFKRLLSSVLALIMMVSSLTMVNVVSVSAATDSWMPAASGDVTYPAWLTFSGTASRSSVASSGSNTVGIFKDENVFGDTSAIAGKPYITTSDKKFTITPNADSATLEIYAMRISSSGSTMKTVTAAGEGTYKLVSSSANVPSSRDTSASSLIYELSGKDSFTFELTNECAIFRLNLTTEGEGEDNEFKWVINDENVKAQLAGKVSFKDDNTSTLTDDNTLVYDGTDYVINPDYVQITSSTKVNGVSLVSYDEATKTYTVNLTMDMFIKTVAIPASSIKVNGVTSPKVLRLRCTIHKDSFHTITLNSNGVADGTIVADTEGNPTKQDASVIYLPTDSYTLQMAGGTVTLNGGSDTLNVTDALASTGFTATFEENTWLDVTKATDLIDITKDLHVSTEFDEAPIFDGTIISDYFQIMGDGLGSTALIRTDEFDEDGNSNVSSIEIKTSSSQDGGLRFKTGSNIPENLMVNVRFSSSTDESKPSKIGLRVKDSLGATTTKHLSDQTVTNAAGTDEFEYGPLEPNKVYGIYNAGDSGFDNVRVIAVRFVEGEIPDTVDFKDVMNADDTTADTYVTGSYLDTAKKFKVTDGGSDKALEIGSSARSFDAPDGNKYDITKNVKLGGTGDTSKRNIAFKAAEDGKVYVYGFSASSGSTDRFFMLKEDGGAEVKASNYATSSGNTLDPSVFDVAAGKTYYLYSNNSGINIYFIGSTAKLESWEEEPAPSGVVEVNPTDDGYTFAGDGHLTTSSTYGGAYASADKDDKLYVEIKDGKALLHDSDDADPIKMTMPLTDKIKNLTAADTVTFSGTLEFANSEGSKWSVLDFQDASGNTVAAIRRSGNDYKEGETINSNRYSLAIPTGMQTDRSKSDGSQTMGYHYEESSISSAPKGTTFTYSITFDYGNKSVNLNLNGEELSYTADSLAAVASIVGITGGTAVNRDYYIGKITITTDKSEVEDPEPDVPTGRTIYKHYVNAADATSNGDDGYTTDENVFPDVVTNNNSGGPSGEKFTIEGKEYEFGYRTGDQESAITINVPEDLSNAVLYVVAKSNGSSDRTWSLTNDTEESKTSEVFSGWTLIKFDNLQAGETYTLKPSGKVYYSFLALAGGEGEVVEPTNKTTITGKVTLKTEYTYVQHENQTNDDPSDDLYSAANGSGEYKKNIVNIVSAQTTNLAGATVTVTKGGVSKTATVADDGTYTVEFDEDTASTEAANYTVRVSGTGVPAGTANTSKTVSVTPGTKTTADFALNTPTYTVKFETNIKDFGFAIGVYDSTGKTKLFDLTDETYHYPAIPAGATSDNARIESITHTIKMPVGTYTIKADSSDSKSKNYSIQDGKGKDLTEFKVASSHDVQKVEIYLITEIKDEVLDILASKLKDFKEKFDNDGTMGSVTRGTYRFVTPNTQTSSGTAKSEYSLGNKRDSNLDDQGIMAEGIYQAAFNADKEATYEGDEKYYESNEGRLGIYSNVDSTSITGYVMFHIAENESYLTKINTANKACVLVKLDENGNLVEVIPTDSRYVEMSVLLSSGYYALISLSAEKSDSPARVTTISFDIASPFEVLVENLKDASNLGYDNAKMIIGTYDYSDDIAGAASIDEYTKFAIFVSENPDILTYAAINGDAKTDFVFEEAEGEFTNSGEELADFEPVVFDMNGTGGTYSSSNIYRDETETVFERIKIDATTPDIEIDNCYVYAIILQNMQPGKKYYAIGAAKTSEAPGAKWLLQDSNPVEVQ